MLVGPYTRSCAKLRNVRNVSKGNVWRVVVYRRDRERPRVHPGNPSPRERVSSGVMLLLLCRPELDIGSLNSERNK